MSPRLIYRTAGRLRPGDISIGGQTFGQNPDILGGHHFLWNLKVLNDRIVLNTSGHLKIEDNQGQSLSSII